MKILTILLFLFNSSLLLAQSKCPSFEKDLRDTLQSIFKDMDEGNKIRNRDGEMINPKSVDDFLSILPEELTTDPIFMSSSQSIQGGTVESPRVLLKSPNSEIVISFTTDPELAGGNHMEIIEFNAEEAKYNMYEVDFPQEGEKIHHDGNGPDPFFEDDSEVAYAEVHRNPEKCIACHKEQTRPVWQPYRFWTGQTPFLEDTLVRDSVETEWFLKYMEKIENGEERWRHITPPFTKLQAQEAVTRNGIFEIPNQRAQAKEFRRTDGSSNDMTNQFLDQNSCMVANNLKDRPDWEQIKYALAGILRGCPSPDEFLPPAFQKLSNDYMEGRNMGVNEDGEFDFDLLVQDTSERLQFSTVYKKDAHRWHLEKHMTPEEAERELAIREDIGFGYRNFENSEREIAGLRYALLPMGININQWSMDNDPMSFAHGQVFSNYVREPIIREVLAETSSCDELKAKSVEALRNKEEYPDLEAARVKSLATPTIECWESPKTPEISELMAQGKNILRSRVADIIENAGCAYCHDGAMSERGQVYVDNTPEIPFFYPEALEGYLSDKPVLMDTILERVSRQSDEEGHMPRFGTSLEPTEIDQIKAYFELIKSEQN